MVELFGWVVWQSFGIVWGLHVLFVFCLLTLTFGVLVLVCFVFYDDGVLLI